MRGRLGLAPEGSSAVLTGANTATPSLTPDVRGILHVSSWLSPTARGAGRVRRTRPWSAPPTPPPWPTPAVNDAYSVTENTALTVPAPGVLGNDTDPDGDTLTAALVDHSQHREQPEPSNPDGSFTYTPAANFTGTDTFTYRANDGSQDSNIAP